MRNVEESIRGLIEFYNANGDPIPWKNTSDQEIPSGAKLQRILVNA